LEVLSGRDSSVGEEVTMKRISRKTLLQGMVGGTAALAGAGRLSTRSALSAGSAGARPIVFCWLLSDEPAGLSSLQQNASLITHLSPSWFGMRSDLSIGGTADPLVVQFARRHGISLHPLLHNDQYDPVVAESILQTPQKRQAAARSIASLVLQHSFDGINLDFEGTFGADREQYADLVQRTTALLRSEGKRVTVDVVPRLAPSAPHAVNAWSAPYDYARLGAACDAVMLMDYDYSVEQPGPVSPLWWVRQTIAYARTQIPPQKLIVGFPLYGRQWSTTNGTKSMTSLTQVEAQQLLAWSGAHVARPAHDGTPRFSWQEGATSYIVHYDDSQSLAAKLAAVDQTMPGVAFWRLGREEPSQWQVLAQWLQHRHSA
jgi:spore germination protein YaaH